MQFSLKTHFVILSHQELVMKDYCTLRPLVVHAQARMYIFWKIDIFGFLESDDDNDDTETPDAGQPPLPGTKYLVRISPHFDKPDLWMASPERRRSLT